MSDAKHQLLIIGVATLALVLWPLTLLVLVWASIAGQRMAEDDDD